MKKLIFLIVMMSLSSEGALCAYKYSIEVCNTPLESLFGFPLLGKHIFIRGTVNGKSKTLNYGPTDRTDARILLNEPVAANVTDKDYENAECEAVLLTNERRLSSEKWRSINRSYENAAQTPYQLFDWNCGIVAQMAIAEAGLKFPFLNINGQDYTGDLRRSVEKLLRKKSKGPQAAADLGLNLAGAVGGLIGGKEGRQITDVAGKIRDVRENSGCAQQ